jgi:hypothetical protein
MVNAVIIKYLTYNDEKFYEDDKVRIYMNKDYYVGHSDRKSVYIGRIGQILDDGCFLYYDNIHMPLDTDDMESIEHI